MTDVAAKGYIDDMIQMFTLMKRTSADVELMDNYIAALRVAYSKLNPQCVPPKKCPDVQFPGQIDIEDYLKEIT